jgi:hypothetical protein
MADGLSCQLNTQTGKGDARRVSDPCTRLPYALGHVLTHLYLWLHPDDVSLALRHFHVRMTD